MQAYVHLQERCRFGWFKKIAATLYNSWEALTMASRNARCHTIPTVPRLSQGWRIYQNLFSQLQNQQTPGRTLCQLPNAQVPCCAHKVAEPDRDPQPRTRLTPGVAEVKLEKIPTPRSGALAMQAERVMMRHIVLHLCAI